MALVNVCEQEVKTAYYFGWEMSSSSIQQSRSNWFNYTKIRLDIFSTVI